LETQWSEFTDEDLSTAAPRVLATLMNVDSEPRQGRWRSDELGEILWHQLQAPLVFDLTSAGGGDAGSSTSLARDVEAGQASNFGALFLHPHPPLPLLRLTKRFAKTSDRRAADPLPAEVATVLYYAAIVAARLRHGERISRVSDATLHDGTAWILRQQWVTGQLRELFVEAQEMFAGNVGTREDGVVY
jgi:hypothetical protein